MRQALDDVTSRGQGLVTARLALDLGDEDEARSGIDHALAASREVIDRLLAPVEGGGVRGGDLRRRPSGKLG